MFTDTHCHIYKEYYENINEILESAKSVGINRIINNGCDTKSNYEVINLCNKYENVYGAIGIHPENVESYSNDDLKYIEENLNHQKIIAIGEIGLDYHYTKDNKEKQIELFERQLKIDENNNLPVIINYREAT